jgi:hypothetical protein
MVTYREIQDYVKQKYDFVPKTCWIAHMKEVCGLSVSKAWSRSGERKYPCPAEKREAIKDAFRHFNMI